MHLAPRPTDDNTIRIKAFTSCYFQMHNQASTRAELTTGRPKRCSIAPQLPVTSEAASNLRRSARLGSTAEIALPLKRKRPVERSAGRSSKRSHLIPPDTLTPDLPSPRSQRHRRRHPSVFDDEYPSASTSYLLPSVDGEKRIRRKENNSQVCFFSTALMVFD